MIVVVESNFVLELAFRQEEIIAAERIMELTRQKTIELAVPACALFEPFETLARRRKERQETLRKFRNEVTQLGRSEHLADLLRTSKAVAQVLAESVQTEAAALDHAIQRILDHARVIPLSDAVLRNSFRVREQFDFEPQDSVIFASVDLFISERGKPESIFANKNSTDFSVPEVEAHLNALNCKLLSTFAATVGVVERRPSKER